jgi:hypothetical protein
MDAIYTAPSSKPKICSLKILIEWVYLTMLIRTKRRMKNNIKNKRGPGMLSVRAFAYHVQSPEFKSSTI